MTEYSKYNIVYRLQKWMDSVPGQTFLNYAYSWGASIVILGTLFKLTHLPGANFMLFLGMGTEVFVFFLSAFDRPFDKTSIGKDLPTHIEEGEEGYQEGENEENATAEYDEREYQPQPAAIPNGPATGGTIIIGGGSYAGGNAVAAEGTSGINTPQDGQPSEEQPQAAAVSSPVIQQQAWVAQQQQVSPEMAEATSNYVEELKNLTEMLSKVSDQSLRLTRDSEEMENLNRTLTGICKVYEMQLKGASKQIGTIDQINDQSRKMAEQIEQLNKIYARMIEAMTVNMRAAAPNAAPDDNHI